MEGRVLTRSRVYFCSQAENKMTKKQRWQLTAHVTLNGPKCQTRRDVPQGTFYYGL